MLLFAEVCLSRWLIIELSLKTEIPAQASHLNSAYITACYLWKTQACVGGLIVKCKHFGLERGICQWWGITDASTILYAGWQPEPVRTLLGSRVTRQPCWNALLHLSIPYISHIPHGSALDMPLHRPLLSALKRPTTPGASRRSANDVRLVNHWYKTVSADQNCLCKFRVSTKCLDEEHLNIWSDIQHKMY